MTPQTTTEILIWAMAALMIVAVLIDWRRGVWKRRADGGYAERLARTEGDLIVTRADRDALAAEIDRLDAVVHAPGDDAGTVDAALAMIDATETALAKALHRVGEIEDDLARLDAEVAPRSNAAGPVDAAIDALTQADAAMAAAGGKIATLWTSLEAATANRDEAWNAVTHRNTTIHDLAGEINRLAYGLGLPTGATGRTIEAALTRVARLELDLATARNQGALAAAGGRADVYHAAMRFFADNPDGDTITVGQVERYNDLAMAVADADIAETNDRPPLIDPDKANRARAISHRLGTADPMGEVGMDVLDPETDA